jgi:predicted amidohydrolase YtcJ
MAMKKIIRFSFLGLSLLLSGPSFAVEVADQILFNGKIITVDDQFRIAQAVAIKGDRILTVGSDSDIQKLRGPDTKMIDLRRKTVIPGLIDNHAHFVRAPEHDELRLDNVTSRKQAIAMIRERVQQSRPGEWIITIGGWSSDQFMDDPRGFPLAELDQIAPNNPVVIQEVYWRSFLNTAALKELKLTESTPDPRGGKILKGNDGMLTGVVDGAGGVAFIATKLPLPNPEEWRRNVLKVVAEMNAMGITAWYDAGGRGMTDEHYLPYEQLAKEQKLNARVFWSTIRQPMTVAEVDNVVAEIARQKPFQGNDYFSNIGWGETTYGPFTTSLTRNDFQVRSEDLAQVRRITDALADRGLMLNNHVEMANAIDALLDEYEALNRRKPIKGYRWVFSHLDQVTLEELRRMQKLGMYAGIHSRPLIQGALMHQVHGEGAWDMPPFKRVQDSGIIWGLGSDATAVTTSNPFYSLYFATTGRMINGKKVNHQSITREEALVAHTRSNAYFLFQEDNLGSIQAGKYADLLILDRDYLTVPLEKIKDIKPLATMVGGKFIFKAQ